MPDDHMGHGHAGVDDHGGSITTKTFEAVAKVWSMPVEEVKKETLKLLKKELGES